MSATLAEEMHILHSWSICKILFASNIIVRTLVKVVRITVKMNVFLRLYKLYRSILSKHLEPYFTL